MSASAPLYPGRVTLGAVVALLLVLGVATALQAAPSDALDSQTDLEFKDTPLRDVVSYLSSVHDVPIDLAPEIDGHARVTVKSTGTVREVLESLVQSQAGVVAADGHRIVIRKSSTPQTLPPVRTLPPPAPTQSYTWLLCGILAIFAVATLLLLRARAHRRRTMKCILVGSAGSLVLLTYFAAFPFVASYADVKFQGPGHHPALAISYAPVIWYGRDSNLPGSKWYSDYCSWCAERIRER